MTLLAYMSPDTLDLALQLLLGGAAALVVVIIVYWRPLLRLFGLGHRHGENGTSPNGDPRP
jgi:hypothetical protein